MTEKDGSRAIVRFGDGRTTQVCEAGKTCSKNTCDCEVAGYKVVCVEPRKVTLQKDAERFPLTIDDLNYGSQNTRATIKNQRARNRITGTVSERRNSAHAVMYRLFAEAGWKPTDTLHTVHSLLVSENIKWSTVFGGI